MTVDGLEYDVCLSFAGEQRPYVERVAAALKARGVQVFYDAHEQVNLWGKDLFAHLTWVYRDAARFCVLFISREYALHHWTTFERQSAQARAFRENREYILPARFDDTEISGLNETTGFIELRDLTPEEFAEKIAEKLLQEETSRIDPLAILRQIPSHGTLAVTVVENSRGIGRRPSARRPEFAIGSTVCIGVELPSDFYISFFNVERLESARRSYLALDSLLRQQQPLAKGAHVLPALPVGEPAGFNCLIAMGRKHPFAWNVDISQAELAREAHALANLKMEERFVATLNYDVI